MLCIPYLYLLIYLYIYIYIYKYTILSICMCKYIYICVCDMMAILIYYIYIYILLYVCVLYTHNIVSSCTIEQTHRVLLQDRAPPSAAWHAVVGGTKTFPWNWKNAMFSVLSCTKKLKKMHQNAGCSNSPKSGTKNMCAVPNVSDPRPTCSEIGVVTSDKSNPTRGPNLFSLQLPRYPLAGVPTCWKLQVSPGGWVNLSMSRCAHPGLWHICPLANICKASICCFQPDHLGGSPGSRATEGKIAALDRSEMQRSERREAKRRASSLSMGLPSSLGLMRWRKCQNHAQFFFCLVGQVSWSPCAKVQPGPLEHFPSCQNLHNIFFLACDVISSSVRVVLKN